jgi:hypothetical protein
MLFTNNATPTFIGKATLEGKGIRLFIPNGFASGEVVFLGLSLTFSLLIGFLVASGLFSLLGVLAVVFAASGALSLSTTSFASVALSLLEALLAQWGWDWLLIH